MTPYKTTLVASACSVAVLLFFALDQLHRDTDLGEHHRRHVPARAVAEVVPAKPFCDLHKTAMFDCQTADLRKFYLPICRTAYTIPQLLVDFAAHQVEWNIFGKTAAFWSVIVQYPHDDNQVTDEMKKQFYASGPPDVQAAVDLVRQVYPTFSLAGDVLDFGCGLGRLGIAFAQRPGVTAVTCVEQSVHHITKTQLNVHFAGETAARFHPIVSTPDLLSSVRQRPDIPYCYDMVHTQIVMQHMIPPLQVMYLEQFCDILRPGGKMMLGMLRFTRNPAYKNVPCDEETRKYYRTSGDMQMHALTPQDAIAILERRGCSTTVIDMKTRWVSDDIPNPPYLSMAVVAEKRSNASNPCVDEN